MMQKILDSKKKSIYQLTKETGLAYSTLNYIVNGRTPFDKCSVDKFYKISKALDMSMDELYEVCNEQKGSGVVEND